MKTTTLVGVQYLRGIAALMVAYMHLPAQIPQYTNALDFHRWVETGRLSGGVDMFFIISGFIMMVTARNSAPADFAMRRVIRIVPLYWSLTLLIALLIIAAPFLFRSTCLTTPALIQSLLFIPYVNHCEHNQLVPLLVPGWTLDYEMFFYSIFAAALFLPQRLRLVTMCGILGALIVIGLSVPAIAEWPVVQFYTRPIIAEFMLGMGIATLYVKGKLSFPKTLSFVLIAAGFVALVSTAFETSVPTRAAAATAIVVGTVAIPSIRFIPILALLGDASYSIYLTHIFTLGMVREVWPRWYAGSAAAVLFAVIAMLAVATIGALVYKSVEMPTLRLLRDTYKRGRSERPALMASKLSAPAKQPSGKTREAMCDKPASADGKGH
jgi:exopolysaccharide production protein ExoZ